jgi:hypothetical protein
MRLWQINSMKRRTRKPVSHLHHPIEANINPRTHLNHNMEAKIHRKTQPTLHNAPHVFSAIGTSVAALHLRISRDTTPAIAPFYALVPAAPSLLPSTTTGRRARKLTAVRDPSSVVSLFRIICLGLKVCQIRVHPRKGCGYHHRWQKSAHLQLPGRTRPSCLWQIGLVQMLLMRPTSRPKHSMVAGALPKADIPQSNPSHALYALKTLLGARYSKHTTGASIPANGPFGAQNVVKRLLRIATRRGTRRSMAARNHSSAAGPVRMVRIGVAGKRIAEETGSWNITTRASRVGIVLRSGTKVNSWQNIDGQSGSVRRGRCLFCCEHDFTGGRFDNWRL